MIDDLDKTLTELLLQNLLPVVAGGVAISFATPDPGFPPASVTAHALNLFLYDIRENRAMRNLESHIERRSDGSGIMRLPPAIFDCSYIATAWHAAGSASPIADEHRLLGELIKLLIRNPVISENLLQGELKDNCGQLPRITIKTGEAFPDGIFWSALGIKPRVALNFTVSFSVRVDPPEETGPLVMKHILKFQVTDDCSGMQKIEKGGTDG